MRKLQNDRTIEHLQKKVSCRGRGSLSISAIQLAIEMNESKFQVKSLTCTFKQIPKSNFIIQKKQ